MAEHNSVLKLLN